MAITIKTKDQVDKMRIAGGILADLIDILEDDTTGYNYR